MKKRTRALALLLAVLFVVLLACSAAYIAVNATHDHIGEHCPICQQIAACRQLLELCALGVAAATLTVFIATVARDRVVCVRSVRTGHTLVSLKVKLSD
ncbi:MAG: hypothetical protein Q4D31_05240 [Eubacteriales bacterium]|nr:hypothetical protein [Eubacteriales bacterium]